ncbi:MAG: ABC transporter permease [Chloroflexi bacterium]|nr:MAG: ABC transporter permease [Chloroflexota bacterium]
MLRYAGTRVAGMVPTVLILLFLAVVMIDFIPGDIVDLMMEGNPSPEHRAEVEAALGLDRSLVVRYFDYVRGLVVGDFGNSLWNEQPILPELLRRIPVTIEIAVLATVIGTATGVFFGVLSALRQDGPLDYVLRSISIIGISFPSFAIATLVVIMPAIWWGVSPTLRYVGPTSDPLKHFMIVLVPSIVLSLNLTASIMRLSRTTMLDVLRQDYIRTARAKGLTTSQIMLRHALKNAMIPVITLTGLQIAFLIGGSVIVESVFVIPGLGRYLLTAVNQRDYPAFQAIVVLLGVFVMAVNLLVDLSYAWFDPRIRMS